MTGLPVPSRALAVGAHPDDVELYAGATLVGWAAAGCEIHILVCTDGSKGSWDVDEDPSRLVATRRDEQHAAAERLGATGEVAFLDRVDGELDADRATAHEVAAWIRRLRPDVLLGHDPWRRWRLHPDHRAAGFLVTDGVVAARDPHFLSEVGLSGLAHHRPDELLLFDTEEPNHAEPVDEVAAATKVAALLAHRSQHLSTMGIGAEDDGSQADAFRDSVLAELAEVGQRFGVPLAEAYRRIEGL
ncbi:MAG: PIG-L family deacetylase [Acidimicrobiales bacterium]|nr:PIG-L family deacetylase [Acidimicrobiales bacterium]